MGCVACQPILNTRKRVFGYELLYRTSMESAGYDAEDGVTATRELLATAFGDIGIQKITGGRRTFVNFPAALLESDIPMLYSKDVLVVEVLESVDPSPDNVEACRRLKTNGYIIALDDFNYTPAHDELVKLADIIKIDFLQYEDHFELKKLIRQISKLGVKVLLAEKVETEEDFELAKTLGFTLFQGFFFSRPKLHAGHHLSPMKLSRLQLLKNLQAEELDFNAMAEIIKRDVVLSHKLLRIVNSAHYGLSFFVSSILHALTILGTGGTKKWISFTVLADCAGDNEQELSRMALMRGLFMEKITVPIKRKRDKETFFLFGLFSMADVLMEAPMDEILSQTNLGDEITIPLVTGEGELADILQIMIYYEHAEWDKASELAEQFHIPKDLISKYYIDALQEAYELI